MAIEGKDRQRAFRARRKAGYRELRVWVPASLYADVLQLVRSRLIEPVIPADQNQAEAERWVRASGIDRDLYDDYARPGEAFSSPDWKLAAWKELAAR